MLTGKALFDTLVAELNDMGLPGMSSTLDEMYHSPDFLNLDPLMAIAMLVEPEYQKKITKRIHSRLRSAHLRGCPQELSNCTDSAQQMQVFAQMNYLFDIEFCRTIHYLGPTPQPQQKSKDRQEARQGKSSP